MGFLKRIRDKEIYCFCKVKGDFDKFKRIFNEFRVVGMSGSEIDCYIDISEFYDYSSACIYVLREEDEQLLSGLAIRVYNVNKVAEIPCHKYLLYIDSFGDIFPCCHQISNFKIGNINEIEIVNKIKCFKAYSTCSCNIGSLTTECEIDSIRHINIELAGLCNGNCIYCFQRNLPTYNKEITIYDRLKYLINAFHPQSILLFGGEIGIQPKTIAFLEQILKDTTIDISIASNGDYSSNTLRRLIKSVNSFQITFNGFSPQTVKAVSKLNFYQQKSNVEYLLGIKDTSIKYLINPLNILELPLFFKWACSKPFSHIIIDSTIITPRDYYKSKEWGKSIFTMFPEFWKAAFLSIKNEVQTIIEDNVHFMQKNCTSLLICNEIRELLDLSNHYFEQIGLSNNQYAKSVSISSLAWRTLL